MRIKSYFAASVQAAISLARKEFGDEVTLVTSHAASLETRHLGEYEVVFAVEEPSGVVEESAPAAEVPAATPPAFAEALRQAIVAPPSTQENFPGKLEQVRGMLLEMGIDGPMVRALMTMIERSAGGYAAASREAHLDCPAEPEAIDCELETAEPEAENAPVMPDARFTPAEMAFFLSVSGGA